MDEKRRYGRLPVNLPVILRHGGRIIPATALNLSCGGMYIRAQHSGISDGLPIEVIFDLGDEQKDVSMRGQIIRVEKEREYTGIGLQFTNLFTLSHKAVQSYVNKHLN